MSILKEIRNRFATVLAEFVDNPAVYLGVIRPSQDSRHGDYQANFPMPLGKALSRPPREVASEIVAKVDLSDLCSDVSIAGPGFINLTLSPGIVASRLGHAMTDEKLGVSPATVPRTFVVDFSSPNVAKPMHVGHIRSTVIGDAISRILRFAGHHVITDNHLGDWGTQFGMIIYGFRRFPDPDAWKKNPVDYLGSLYRKVRGLIDYHAAVAGIGKATGNVANAEKELAALKMESPPGDPKEARELRKKIDRQQTRLRELKDEVESLQAKIDSVQSDPDLRAVAEEHADIGNLVLQETAALHEGDETSLRLWNEFLPCCLEDIERIYRRLNVTFDHQLGESFYHDQLASVVEDMERRGLTRISDGATCVFLDGFETPMIVRKRDGAFLYATTDLATIQYRIQLWKPDMILYVVDHRQHEHFEKLFAAAAKCGWGEVDLLHISFGTVLGDDGRPFRTRAGDTVGLASLLDEAEEKARAVLRDMDSPHLTGLNADELENIARVVGIGALKYADLSQNRASDYKFSYDKMLELKGNTATYLQYLYARVQGVFREGGVDPATLRGGGVQFVIETDVERHLAIMLLRFGEAIDDTLVEFRPNLLAQYMFELAQQFFRFYDQCPVLKADSEALRFSRLGLCDLTARTIRTGLGLLGIDVVDRM